MKRTNKDIKQTSERFAGLTVPKGTRVSGPITEGSTKGCYWVDEFGWIADQTGSKDSIQKHDAVHYGIVIQPEDVEESNQ